MLEDPIPRVENQIVKPCCLNFFCLPFSHVVLCMWHSSSSQAHKDRIPSQPQSRERTLSYFPVSSNNLSVYRLVFLLVLLLQNRKEKNMKKNKKGNRRVIKEGRYEVLLPCEAGLRLWSFQFLQTSSQERSCRSLYNVGNLGFCEACKNPRCLKLTISPGCGCHRLANSVVPAGAENRTPLGLWLFCFWLARWIHCKLIETYNSHSHSRGPALPTTFASASLNFSEIKIVSLIIDWWQKKDTLCLR